MYLDVHVCKFLCVLFIALVLYDEAGRQAKIDEKIFPKIKVTGSISFAVVLFDTNLIRNLCVYFINFQTLFLFVIFF